MDENDEDKEEFSLEELIKNLTDPNDIVRMDAVQALLKAAENEIDISPAIEDLTDALGDETIRGDAAKALTLYFLTRDANKIGILLKYQKDEIRINTTLELSKLAKEGADISNVFILLIDTLKDENNEVQSNATIALTWYSINKNESEKVANLLKNSDMDIREAVVSALEYAISVEGKDISPAIPALVEALSDESSYARSSAVVALCACAKKGFDISNAIPMLEKIANNEDEVMGIRRAAKDALKYCHQQ